MQDSIFEVPQTPDLTEGYEPRRKSVETAEQAKSICARMRDDNSDRVEIAASIRRKVDGIDPPLSPAKLAEEGKSYKSNFSTGFLGTIVSRAVPRFVMRVKSSQHLTASKLPVKVDNSVEKTQAFRKVVTNVIRNWPGWNFFLYQVANLNVLDGKCFVGYDGPDNWRPQVFRIDDAGIPDGIKQGQTPPFFRIERNYTVSQMFDFIRERQFAEDAGWDIENVVEAINEARPRREDEEATPQESALKYEDLVRQVIPHYGFSTGYNSISVDILFTEEYDGTVSQWVIDRDTGNELFYSESLYRSMNDVVQYICYDIGDGTVYGSYGVGESIFDLSVHLEKARNSALDNLMNRGKFMIKIADASAASDVKIEITDDAVFSIGGEPVGSQMALPSSAESFITIDRYVRSMAEEKAGVFVPDNQQTDKTATQAQIDALKENETTDSKLDFFLTYISKVVSMIQRRMMNPDTSDLQAQLARRELLEVMTEEELQAVANMPPAQTSVDWSEAKQAQTAQFLATKLGNPMWNQYLLEKTISDLTIGPEITEQMMLPKGDETPMIEATRQQEDETFTRLSQGVSVPVSPRDNHMISMSILSGDKDPQSGNWTGQIFALLQEGNIQGAQTSLEHYIAHAQQAESQNQLGEYQNTVKQFIADVGRGIERANQINQKTQEQMALVAQEAQGI